MLIVILIPRAWFLKIFQWNCSCVKSTAVCFVCPKSNYGTPDVSLNCWNLSILICRYVVFVKIYKRFLCIKAYVTQPLRTILGNPTHAWNFHHLLYSTWIRYTCAIYVIHKCFMRFPFVDVYGCPLTVVSIRDVG